MIHSRRQAVGIAITALGLFLAALAGCGSSSIQGLQSMLNSTGYNLVYPARSDVFAGGIVVANKKSSSFYGLPAGAATPHTENVTAAWAATQIDSSFNLQAVLTGVGSVVGAGASADRNRQESIAQINATGAKVSPTPDTVIADPVVAAQVKQWLQDKTAGYRVYVVNTALTTGSISITTSTSGGGTAAFGTTLSCCPTANSTSSSSSSGSSFCGSSSSGTSPTKGNLQICMNSSSQFTLSTSTPLVFATLLNPVELNANGSLAVVPITTLTPVSAIAREASAPANHPAPHATTQSIDRNLQIKPWPAH